MISLSCHVSVESGGDGDLVVRWRGCAVVLCAPDSSCNDVGFCVDLFPVDDTKATERESVAKSETMRGCVLAWGVSGISGMSSVSPLANAVFLMLSVLVVMPGLSGFASPCVSCSASDVPLSERAMSSFGFLCATSSVGESGYMGTAVMLVRLMPRSWSATAFLLGLSLPERVGLPLGGVEAGRRAVLSSGTGGGWLRLRLGDGCTADSDVGGMLAV